MQKAAPNLVDLARQFISIDTTTSHGTLTAAKWVSDLARLWNLNCEIIEETWNGIANANLLICAKNFEPSESPYILTTRLDTSDPGEYAVWTKTGANPFNASINGDSLFGLGTADSKLDFLCKLLAFRESSLHAQPTASLVGTFGRESGTGAIRLIRQKRIKPQGALVGAPTGLKMSRRAPGFAKVEITIALSDDERRYIEQQSGSEGATSQSKIFSRVQKQQAVDLGLLSNPILRMMDYLKNLPSGIAILSVDGGTSAELQPDFVELEVQIVDHLQDGVISKLISVCELIKKLAVELKSVEAKEFLPAHSTINVGQIRMLPEQVVISGICRLVPTAHREIYDKWLERMRVDCAAAGAQFHILDYKPPFISNGDAPFFNLLKRVSSKMGFDSGEITARQCTEANVFQRLGVETVIFGPGVELGNDPISLEHVKISELNSAIDFYREVLLTQEVLK